MKTNTKTDGAAHTLAAIFEIVAAAANYDPERVEYLVYGLRDLYEQWKEEALDGNR